MPESLDDYVAGDNSQLIVRDADVTLKESRPLVLMVRETPSHKGHLDLMTGADDYGAVILPPIPALYHNPKSIMDIIHATRAAMSKERSRRTSPNTPAPS